MVLTEKVLIRMRPKMLKTYYSLGYYCKLDDIIEIKIEDLTKGSKAIIDVKCDICGLEKKLPYRVYIKNIKNGDYYCCSKKCGEEKYKNTCIKKYGVDSYTKTNECKNKMKQTNLERYGFEYGLQSEEIKNKRLKTNIEKYGVDNYNKSEDVKNKIKLNNINKYGVGSIFQLKYIKDKIKNTHIENFGIFYSKTIEYKNRTKNTRIKNGNQIPDELKTPIELYKIKVRNLTKLNKNKLFENWNGYDYYENDYIRDNINLKYTSKLYPTIDHKLSIFYGFINNISVEEIGSINNLCITKRSVNSRKQKTIEKDFIILFSTP